MINTIPKISVIIPVYNVAQYLERCIDSLINQTLSNIEIICVDDKSTDNSLDILRKYEQADKRIHVIALDKNSGVAVARNTGINAACGQYLGFVDPDDYVDLNFYEKLYAKAIETGADITVGNIRERMLDNTTRDFTKWLSQIEENKIFFNYTQWCAIYKTPFIKNNQVQNPQGLSSSEDTVFVIKCAILANKIVIVPDTFYNYVRVAGSLSSEYLSDDKIEHKIQAANLILDFLNEQNLSEQDYYAAFAGMFRFMAHYCFFRTTKAKTRMLIMNATLDLFKKFKHKDMLQKYEPKIYPYLVCDDADGLYEYIAATNLRKPAVTKIKLFNCIPVARIKKYRNNHVRVSLLGIPLISLRLPKNNDGVKYNG